MQLLLSGPPTLVLCGAFYRQKNHLEDETRPCVKYRHVAHQNYRRTWQITAFPQPYQGLRSLALASGFVSLLGPSRYFWIRVFGSNSLQICTNVQIRCIFQKLSNLASKKSGFNYSKIGLIKLLLPFCSSSLDYLQKRPKHG